ncbi:MAG TPA: prolipoprotein diacylglyceryl transferase [Lacunisphaera sp.]|jgi:phosphatidylglycerol:prolipoprotein diacylglycerol transferase|nr:prolipoprotein diacylglyceryl transferase [Lacunisphaera sp.]
MSSAAPLAYWVHDLSPFLIRFNEHLGIRYYGLAYLAGFAAAGWLLRRYHQAGRSDLNTNAIIDLMTALVVGVVLGGRLGYFLLYQFDLFRHDPLVFFRVWEGGMASHGGFLGVLVALWWFSRKHGASLLQVADLVVSAAPLGLFFGRLANFVNGELWGKPATVPWAVIFPLSEPPGTPVRLILPRHPSQLYEAGLEGLLLFLFMQWRFWRSDVARVRPGRLAGEFLVAYAVARAIGELFREPDAALILGLSRGTFYSIFLVVAGSALIVLAPRRPVKA